MVHTWFHNSDYNHQICAQYIHNAVGDSELQYTKMMWNLNYVINMDLTKYLNLQGYLVKFQMGPVDH